MFSDLISRNSRRSRKENGLFFASLLVTIIAFYMVLSLAQQDVMVFLRRMESGAVNRLLTLIPQFYGITLVILFFLIYFACKFQLERRRHEFGVYLMMGMRRTRLFLMLLAEDLRNSILALVIGLPVAVLLSELVSLVTAQLVGLGIIGHRFSLSWSALLWTTVGFLLIKLAAFLILSGRIARQEIGSLLTETPEGTKKSRSAGVYWTALILGVVFLAAAYAMAICGLSWSGAAAMGLTLLLGLVGTLSVFYGLRCVIGWLARRGNQKQVLHLFTFRQLEENVIRRSSTLAISSLLILAALCCFGSGVAIAQHYGQSERHVLDYTFRDASDLDTVRETLADHDLRDRFSDLFLIKTGYINTTEDYDNAFRLDRVQEALQQKPRSMERDGLLNNLEYANYPYLISLSGYNHLLSLAGEPEIELAHGEAAVYMDANLTSGAATAMLDQVLSNRPAVEISGEPYVLTDTVRSINLVTDRSLTLSFALILTDEDFDHFTIGDYTPHVSGVLNRDVVGNQSLMNAIAQTNDLLDGTGLSYESYLQNMGRQLFYVVAASYITIYLAIIFLIIANTVIGVQFLTSQQKTGRRYQTLVRLGASYEALCQSAGRQIRWYFGIPTVVAVISSLFGVRALFSGLLSSMTQSDLPSLMLISGAMVALLLVVECIYIAAVNTASRRTIRNLMEPVREE